MAERAPAFAKALAVVAMVIAIDQLCKQLAIANVEPGKPFELMFGIEIANVRNPGVAFGLLSGSDLAILAFTLVALTALAIYFWVQSDRPLLWLVVGLLAGGAIANLIDRLRTGEVIDFIDLPAWPAFNLADVAIVLGAAGLAIVIIGNEPEHGHRD